MPAFLAGPAGKLIGAVFGVIALFVSGAWWGYHQSETNHQASIMEQALEANASMREANDNIARLRGELALTMERLVKKENDAIAIKERYEKSKEEKFLVGHQLQLAIDALSRLYNDTSADRVSATDPAPERTVDAQAPVSTSVALLRAYGECTEQLDRVLDAYYYPVVKAYETSYAIALKGAGYP